MAGKTGFPGPFQLLAEFERWTKVDWQPPGWEWVDPQKEATASVVAIKNNLATLQEELGKRGKDLRTTLEQRKRENDMVAELGLTEMQDLPGIATSIESGAKSEKENSKAQTTTA